MQEFIERLRNEAGSWCRGRNWQLRSLLLFWFGYVLFRHLSDPMYASIIAPLNLGIHELGHLVFSFFGNFIGTLGGTILQVLIPLAGAINFYRQRDFFAIALSFGWLSTSLFDVARYVADARAMSLPLVSPFGVDTVVHDWNYILSRLGMLKLDLFIAFLLKCAATGSMLICLLSGLWLLLKMKESSANPQG